jgi:radical SAM superfamily enzyme YgiQ (UPF0313 family)
MNILLVNPWIHDFAAFDLWLKPLGLLYIGSILEACGDKVRLLDTLDRLHPSVRASNKNQAYTTGKFHSEEIEKPRLLHDIPRRYKRYGIPREAFSAELQKSKPDLILMTSAMTYWYPGVFEAIRLCKKIYPSVPIILGGIYATLESAHAKAHSGADYVFEGSFLPSLMKLIDTISGTNTHAETRTKELAHFPSPAYHLYPELHSASILSSLGCPNNCSYCAIRTLHPDFHVKSPESVIAEISALKDRDTLSDIAFYDDALLYNAESHFIPLAKKIENLKLPISFHTPNGLSVRDITPLVAEHLFRAHFKTLRLSFESVSTRIQRLSSEKTSSADLVSARNNLTRAGFTAKDISVYILAGMPDQTLSELTETIDYVHSLGLVIKLALFSPIPGTREYEKTRTLYPFITQDPLFHNNTVYTFKAHQKNSPALSEIQARILALNEKVLST